MSDKPADLADELARARAEVRGWKVTALSSEQQRDYLTDRPVAGALLSPFMHAAPAALSAGRGILKLRVAFFLERLDAFQPAFVGHADDVEFVLVTETRFQRHRHRRAHRGLDGLRCGRAE